MSSSGRTMGGNQNVAAAVEVMQLNEASQQERQAHQMKMLEVEAKQRAGVLSADIPTLPKDVRTALRSMGLPVRLFGENLANVRDRLRLEVARREIIQEKGISITTTTTTTGASGAGDVFDELDRQVPVTKEQEEEEKVTKYSRAEPELIAARTKIVSFSLARSKQRLEQERMYRTQWQRKRTRMEAALLDKEVKDESSGSGTPKDEDEESFAYVTKVEAQALASYKSLRNFGLEGSQYGDARPISSIATARTPVANVPLVATGSWSGTIKLWDGSSSELQLVGQATMAHEDRIMGIATQPQPQQQQESTLLATASIDLTAKLWKVQKSDVVMEDTDTATATRTTEPPSKANGDDSSFPFVMTQVAHLKGHAARLCSTAFHPSGEFLATTSFDHTWRLWDVETSQQILLQDGHWKETYGVGFHPDGSLISTTDFGGVVQVWDLRTGKSISHFMGHAKRVICSEFSPNGFLLGTAGDDGTIKVWDLRKRKQFASVPAHSNIITQLRFDTEGEYLASSSFDGTAKLWSTRDWKMLSTLKGHEGKVMGIDLLKNSVVTCGFDKTLKLWK